jgi:hypothetical protein
MAESKARESVGVAVGARAGEGEMNWVGRVAGRVAKYCGLAAGVERSGRGAVAGGGRGMGAREWVEGVGAEPGHGRVGGGHERVQLSDWMRLQRACSKP